MMPSATVTNNEDEEGIHLHCLSCHSLSCHEFLQCTIIHCAQQCGVQLHQCKEAEHLLVCRRIQRPCVNQFYGCPFKVDSVNMMTHLEHCPAGVIHCGINWNRSPLHSKVREQWLPFHEGNPVGIEGQLDLEFAIADQERLKKEYKFRMMRGVKKSNEKRNKDKKISVGTINRDRLKHLEHLLTGGKYVKYSRHSSTNRILEDDFVTCDHLFSNSSNEAGNKNHVSNTNMRDSYFEVPNMYIYNGNLKQSIITKSAQKRDKEWIGDDEEEKLTEEEVTARSAALSGLNLSTYPLGLNVVVECLPAYFDQYPLYRFACGSLFRRDQYKWHCENVHGDIGFNLNGWLLQRCPLAQYGCPYVQHRMKPKDRSIRFLRDFSCFSTYYDEYSVKSPSNKLDVCGTTSLLDLPTEIIVYLFFYLDNLSLNSVAKTCHLLRDLCYSMVDDLGIVVTTWYKKSYEKSGASSWQEEQKIRFFSTSCSPLRDWTYTEHPHMGQHMKTCAFFKRNKMTSDKVKLLVG